MTFEVWGGAIADKECTFNSVELRAVDVQLEPCQQLGLGVVRRSAPQGKCGLGAMPSPRQLWRKGPPGRKGLTWAIPSAEPGKQDVGQLL